MIESPAVAKLELEPIAVVAIWATVEIYTQGAHNAFGGRLAAWIGSGDASPERSESTRERVGNAVGRAHAEHDARYDELLPE